MCILSFYRWNIIKYNIEKFRENKELIILNNQNKHNPSSKKIKNARLIALEIWMLVFYQ